MRNLILIGLEVVICYITLMFLSKKYKEDGIYIYCIIATIISCIMNFKNISIMGVSIPIGFGVTTSILIGANLIIQKRGQEEIKKYLLLVLISFLTSYCFFQLSSIIESSSYNFISNNSYNSIFNQNVKPNVALIISIMFSIWLESKLYYIIKKLKNKIILSNIFSLIITEFFENIIFILIAYLFEYKPIDIFLCIILRYIIKTSIGLIGTIPLYIANKYN